MKKRRSVNKLDLRRATISSLERVSGGLKDPIRGAQSIENTTCMSMSGCDTY
jgi:hypothetical protein